VEQHLSTKERKRDLRYEIRDITARDVEGAADLIARLKRLNGEFDPLFRTSDKVDQDSLSTLKARISDKDFIILVAVSQSKVVGVIKAAIRDRVYYEPRKEGAIVRFHGIGIAGERGGVDNCRVPQSERNRVEVLQ
jgi:hypothetical protein